jgi:3-dehydroquinate synthase
MLMAANLSAREGWISEAELARIERLLTAAGLPVAPPETMSCERFIELMAVDKKVIDGNLRLVLLQQLGQGVVTADFAANKLEQTLICGQSLGRIG